ncbi:MAG TPA: alpha-glucan family phosphorylase [Candidatus Binatia bacterium]|nr:alpha-glucan family phosphorylase [Candidatus Binatia bacterium]
MDGTKVIAYFSMEIALQAEIPTYSGGLGVLAGDTIRAAADLKVPMVGITLAHRKGYFHQTLDANGWQSETPEEWLVEGFVSEMSERVTVTIDERTVQLRCWRFEVRGEGNFRVPVFLLDSDLPGNSDYDRTLTHHLYGGDQYYRLCQEIILGIGGIRVLRALGYRDVERFHMNEGHSSLIALELLDEQARSAGRSAITPKDLQAVREKCIFTTHTPVPAGHDKFPLDLVARVLGRQDILDLRHIFGLESALNMTHLALNVSHYVNGVAKKHGEVSRLMFSGYNIDEITNGVHGATWISEPFQELFDHYIPGWRQDNFSLRYALSIPRREVWKAHAVTKTSLLAQVRKQTGVAMNVETLTLGFARRAATYKRADLLFTDLDRLRRIAGGTGPFQIVFAGKAHPQDQAGKEVIHSIFGGIAALRNEVKIAYLENYDLNLGKLLTAGVDVWLNTPQPPLEASGTSGMKAALNGVPSLSILDGWWIEGCIEGITGWAISNKNGSTEGDERARDAVSLYDKLEKAVLPLYVQNRSGFIDLMRHAIALNGSFFNTHRMLQQYVIKAYF